MISTVSSYKEETQIEFFKKSSSNKDSLLAILQNIERILVKNFGEDDHIRWMEEKELKFKFAAIVLDRFFFYLSILYFIVTFIALVMTIPNFYQMN